MTRLLLIFLSVAYISSLDAQQNRSPFVTINGTGERSFGIVHSVTYINGALWIGADNGLFVQKGSLVSEIDINLSHVSYPVSGVAKLKNKIFVATYGGGIAVIDQNYQVTEQMILAVTDDNFILAIKPFNVSKLLLETINGTILLDIEDESIARTSDTILRLTGSAQLIDLVTSRETANVIYALTDRGIFTYVEGSTTAEVVVEDKVFSTLESAVLRKSSDHFLVFAQSSIYRVTPETNEIDIFASDRSVNYEVSDVVQLSGSDYLVARENLTIASDALSTEGTFMDPFLANKSLNVVYDITKTPNENIVLGGPVFGITWLPKTFKHLSYVHENQTPKDGRFTGFGQLSEDKLVIGFGDSVYYLDKSDGSLTQIEGLDASMGLAIISDKLYALDTEGRLSENRFVNGEFVNVNIYSNRAFSELETFNDQLVLLGADGGLYTLKESTVDVLTDVNFNADIVFSVDDILVVQDYFNGVFISFDGKVWAELELAELGQHVQIECVERDRSGQLYFCTSGNGILMLKNESLVLQSSKLNDFIDSMFIRSLKSDSNGTLWVATNNGLYRANPYEEWVQSVGEKDGIVDLDFEYEGMFFTNNKRELIVIGDKLRYQIEYDGFVSILDQYLDRYNEVSVHTIHNFSTAIKGQISEAFSEDNGTLSNITIDSDVYQTIFHFSSTDPIDHRYLTYEYRMLGLDETWVKSALQSPFAVYSKLPFGDYEFQVRAIDNQSSRQQPIAFKAVTVLPPFWMTRYALLLYFVVLIVIFWSYHFWKTNAKRARELELEEHVDKRTKNLEAEKIFAEQQMRRTKDLFRKVSHEIRTPLTLITRWAKELNISHSGDADKQKLAHLEDNSKRLRLLVDELNEFEWVRTKKETRYVNYDIKRFLESFVDMYQPVFDKFQVSAEIRAKNGVIVSLPEGMLDKLLSNLVSNAIKYSPAGGVVSLRARANQENAEISVTDQGYGIPVGEQDRIFERFFRSETHAKKAGAGIGLAIVKELLAYCDGSIEVKSQLNKGSTFTITLPLNRAPSNETSTYTAFNSGAMQLLEPSISCAEYPRANVDVANAQNTIIIADESTHIRQYIKELFEPEFMCITAANGREAMDVVKEFKPSAVIADVSMPLKDGLTLTKEIRASESNSASAIPIILISAFSDTTTRIESLKAKADDYLIKPFNDLELKLKVRQLIAKSKQPSTSKQHSEEIELQLEDFDLPEFTSEKDHRFFMKFLVLTKRNYMNDTFDRLFAAEALGCCDRQLNRKLNKLVNHNFTSFLKEFRLKQARKMLMQTENISAVAFDVGFTSPSYFGSCFKAAFDMTPTEYIEQCKVIKT